MLLDWAREKKKTFKNFFKEWNSFILMNREIGLVLIDVICMYTCDREGKQVFLFVSQFNLRNTFWMSVRSYVKLWEIQFNNLFNRQKILSPSCPLLLTLNHLWNTWNYPEHILPVYGSPVPGIRHIFTFQQTIFKGQRQWQNSLP